MRFQGYGVALHTGIFAPRVTQMESHSWSEVSPDNLVRNALQHTEHRVISTQNAANRCGGINAQGLKFAKQKQSKDMVEIGIGQYDTCNRRLTQSLARM